MLLVYKWPVMKSFSGNYYIDSWYYIAHYMKTGANFYSVSESSDTAEKSRSHIGREQTKSQEHWFVPSIPPKWSHVQL